jgi:probable rRNA maturation factor
MKVSIARVRGVVFVNLQKRYIVRTASLLAFARSLKRKLGLEKSEFNVCFVSDDAIRRLNIAYRGINKATDILSFPWRESERARPAALPATSRREEPGESASFLGEVVISVESARRNAAVEGHATLTEIRWLILHGILHLLGYDHETDSGQMTGLELDLREKLKVAGGARRRDRRKEKTKGRMPRAKGHAAVV